MTAKAIEQTTTNYYPQLVVTIPGLTLCVALWGTGGSANLTYVFFKATPTPTPKADEEGEEQSHYDPREEEEAAHKEGEEEEEEGGHEHKEERYVATVGYSPVVRNVYVCISVIMHVMDTSSGIPNTE